MDQQTVIGLLFLVFGGLNVLRPDLMVRFQVWSQRVVMGAHLVPGESTQNANRVFGVFFFLLGLLLVTKVLQ